jgi:hypothetical protein
VFNRSGDFYPLSRKYFCPNYQATANCVWTTCTRLGITRMDHISRGANYYLFASSPGFSRVMGVDPDFLWVSKKSLAPSGPAFDVSANVQIQTRWQQHVAHAHDSRSQIYAILTPAAKLCTSPKIRNVCSGRRVNLVRSPQQRDTGYVNLIIAGLVHTC